MVTGFVLRSGSNGTTNLTATGRTTLPAWAQRIQAVTFKNGPAVGTNYLLGHYIEDYDYLGDRGYTQGVHFDLNEQNVRWCVTPEFPSGTWAYFTTINADGTPAFPYTTGRQYFGTPSGGDSTISETVTTWFHGSPSLEEAATPPAVNPATGDVTLVWSAAEGGSYLVEASTDLKDWPDDATNVTATGATASIVESGAANVHDRRFYRVSRTALAPFDTAGFDYTDPGTGGGGGSTMRIPISLAVSLICPLMAARNVLLIIADNFGPESLQTYNVFKNSTSAALSSSFKPMPWGCLARLGSSVVPRASGLL